MLSVGPILGPGTVDDLIADARLLGRKSSQRNVKDWQDLGLLDYPAPGAGLGRGRGREKDRYSVNQRKLFRELMRQRREGGRVAALAGIPVYLWAYWGDQYVPLSQTRRAMRTFVETFKGSSRDRAREVAREIVGQLADPRATAKSRQEAITLLSQAVHSGSGVDGDLFDVLVNVYDPLSEGRLAGPPGMPMDVTVISRNAIVREQAVRALIDPSDPVPDEAFESARQWMRGALRDYLSVRPELAAAAGEMSRFIQEPTMQQIAQDSCSTLTTLIGLELQRKQT